MQKHSPFPLKPWILLAASLLSCLFALLARLCFQFKMQGRVFFNQIKIAQRPKFFGFPKVDLSWRHHKWTFSQFFYKERTGPGQPKQARAPRGLAPTPHGRNGRGSS